MKERNLRHRLEILGRLSSITEELEGIVKDSSSLEKEGPQGHELLAQASTLDANAGKAPSLVAESLITLGLKAIIVGKLKTDCYIAGKIYSLRYSPKTPDQVQTVLKNCGLEVKKFKKMGLERYQVVLTKGLTAGMIGKSKHPVCFIETGLLTGLIERLSKAKLIFKELECVSAGAKQCVFETVEIQDIETMDASTFTGSLPLLPMEQYSEENIRLLTSLASHALTAIENSLLFEKTRRQTIVDTLTGVYNHRYFQQALRLELKRSQRHKQPLSLLMIDVDRFKKINDSLGHVRGDKVLKLIARVLAASVREIDIVSRYGGDEFAIILPQTPLEGAVVVAKRIQSSLKNASFSKETHGDTHVTIGIGLACCLNGSEEASKFIKRADQALIKAKAKGVNHLLAAKPL